MTVISIGLKKLCKQMKRLEILLSHQKIKTVKYNQSLIVHISWPTEIGFEI